MFEFKNNPLQLRYWHRHKKIVLFGVQVVCTSVRLLQAIVDVLSSKSAKSACLLAMELCQMVVQGQHRNDSWLLQLPGMTKTLADKCEAAGIEDIGALQEMEDVERRTLLGMTDAAYDLIARFCNRYPNDVQVVYTVVNGKDCTEGEDDDVRLFECEEDTSLVRSRCLKLLTPSRSFLIRTLGGPFFCESVD